MAAEKRTVGSEVREFFTEIQDGFREWRLRASARSTPRSATPPTETLSPDLSEITFVSLDLEADAVCATPGAGKAAKSALLPGSVCPVTRQALNLKSKRYQCRQCGIYYSPEGWEFLCDTAKGQCCGCHCVNTVLPVVRGNSY